MASLQGVIDGVHPVQAAEESKGEFVAMVTWLKSPEISMNALEC